MYNSIISQINQAEYLEKEKRNTPVTDEDGVRGMPCENEEFLHQFTPTGMPKYNLRLKVEAIIMLIKNLDISEGLCNGTRLIVLSILRENRLLHCKNLITGAEVYITRIPLNYSDETTGIAFDRFQFPVRLTYCMTVNKSQGQTFEKVVVILRTPSLAHGSTYVALSRVRTRKNIRVTANWGPPLPEILKIRNVVYADIMED
ncbi:hypothetical protein Y032_0021g345 [Ancylostoma ceylanicum]|uniref:Uncharacterized protein n=1 Tax=Ancylostoma ceylanicum TaxID=53326 RepID=A0A016UZR2_9BILA|nr:hypothetical protein Y032_0021g345 [Ancylostoma ceylanicum]